MMKIRYLPIFLLMQLVGCGADSSEKMRSEQPYYDYKLEINNQPLSSITDVLDEFGRLMNLHILRNDSGQMAVLNAGSPAFSYWFFIEEGKSPAIVVFNVNEGNSMRVMFFRDAFSSEDELEEYRKLLDRELSFL